MSGAGILPKWEFLVVQYVGSVWSNDGKWDRPELENFTTEQMLNHFGAIGWDLAKIGPVHSNSGAPSAAYILKRQVT